MTDKSATIPHHPAELTPNYAHFSKIAYATALLYIYHAASRFDFSPLFESFDHSCSYCCWHIEGDLNKLMLIINVICDPLFIQIDKGSMLGSQVQIG